MALTRLCSTKFLSYVCPYRNRPLHVGSILFTSIADVLVVGGGHAGCEAAAAAARTGAKTVLLTHNRNTIGAMSCNPSFGGIGKGHLLVEVDALDGVCPMICDKAGISFRVLNRPRGYAIWGLRAQMDRSLYKQFMLEEMLRTPNLTIIESSVDDLIIVPAHEEGTMFVCQGVQLSNGSELLAKSVVLATGTFLGAEISIGNDVQSAGRLGDPAANGLSQTLHRLDFKLGRLKTGTPPRVLGSSINFNMVKTSPPDSCPIPFSFMNDKVSIPPGDQLNTWLTFTRRDDAIWKIVMSHMHENRHVREETRGPRYCPSIESKVLRYKDLEHRVWLEPEGLKSDVVYPQGLSCTLPEKNQLQLLHNVPGLENARIVQPGYGVEYDHVHSTQLRPSLETRKVSRLFLCGQINGTTGYEEAAAQGVIAGVCASHSAGCAPVPLILSRTNSYIGVMIDDLVCTGTNEPYRMFTTRAEFRLSLRPDNADSRLTELGRLSGCVSDARWEQFLIAAKRKQNAFELAEDFQRPLAYWCKLMKLKPTRHAGTQRSALEMLNSFLSVEDLFKIDSFAYLQEHPLLCRQLKAEAVYREQEKKQAVAVENLRREENILLPDSFDYRSLHISSESKEKLEEIRPYSLGGASRIPGVTPSDLLKILASVKKGSAEMRTAS